jgi:hypothetical protein
VARPPGLYTIRIRGLLGAVAQSAFPAMECELEVVGVRSWLLADCADAGRDEVGDVEQRGVADRQS